METQSTLPAPLDHFIARMPKVELHLHLEGTIQPATLLEIARRNQVEIPASTLEDVQQLFNYGDFHEFLSVFMMLVRALIHARDFEQIAYELGHQLADQQVRYSEVMLSPSQYYRRGLDLDEVVAGAAAGFARARRERGIQVNLVFDYGRQFGIDAAWEILEIAIRNRDRTLVGWSIGGDEVNYPPELFAEVFSAARRAGLHTMAHAGEVVGPPSVWGAVDALGCERIGHGIRSVEDLALLAHLRERNVTLDVSPTSNFRTGAVSNPALHPMRQLYDDGVAITINSDDPTFFQTTLTDEYRLAARAFGFTADELAGLVLNAARATFLQPDARDLLVQQLDGEIRALRSELGV